MVWEVLLRTQTLKDGMSLTESQKSLGPPTEKSDERVGWYFNLESRHVAPCLHAPVTKEGLAGGKVGYR